MSRIMALDTSREDLNIGRLTRVATGDPLSFDYDSAENLATFAIPSRSLPSVIHVLQVDMQKQSIIAYAMAKQTGHQLAAARWKGHDMTTKRCTACKQVKPRDEFYQRSLNGRCLSMCKPCMRAHLFQKRSDKRGGPPMARGLNDYEIRGDHACLFLKRRNGCTFECLVDLDTLERLKVLNRRWQAGHGGYAIYRVPPLKTVFMHRWILELGAWSTRSSEVDHVNRNPLDNRRINLRHGDRAANARNKDFPLPACGERYITRRPWGKYSIYINGKGRGTFVALSDAVAARDRILAEEPR